MTKRERQLAEYVADAVADAAPVAWAGCPPADNDSGWLFFRGREAAESCVSIAPGWRVIPLYTLVSELADAMLREYKQTAPPCVETDGFSPGSSSDPINRNAERESPRGECGESPLRDVARPDTKGKVAGGPEPSYSECEGGFRVLRNAKAPVAWAVLERDGFGVEGTFTDRDEAAEWCDSRQEIVPLCRQSQDWAFLNDEIARLRLTDEEREAIGVAIQCVVAAKAQRHPEEEESHELLHKTAATLRGLLERTK